MQADVQQTSRNPEHASINGSFSTVHNGIDHVRKRRQRDPLVFQTFVDLGTADDGNALFMH